MHVLREPAIPPPHPQTDQKKSPRRAHIYSQTAKDNLNVHHDHLPTALWVADTHRALKGFIGVNPRVNSVGCTLLSPF